MEKLKSMTALKIISYILAPILLFLIVISILHIVFLSSYEYIEDGDKENYLQTSKFSNQYFYSVLDKLSNCKRTDSTTRYINLQDETGRNYYYLDDGSSSTYVYIDYIIIDKETGNLFTNIKSNNYEEEISNIGQNQYHWNIVDGKIYTDFENINEQNIKYNYTYQYQISENGNEVNSITEKNLNDYNIYTLYNKDRTESSIQFTTAQGIYEYIVKCRTQPVYTLIISSLLLLIIIIYLIWSIGYKKESKDIVFNSIDKIPYEILFIICMLLISIFLTILISVLQVTNYIIFIVAFLCYIICYIFFAILANSTIKRIKAGKFLTSFLTFKFIRCCIRKYRKFKDELKYKTENTKKVFWYYWGFILLSIVLASMSFTGLAIILLIVLWIWVFYKIRKYIRQEENIKETLKKIYGGNTEVHINEEKLEGTLRQMAIYINDIAGGFTNAIEESLKSERLKTELITNVSHDIKTPLTSIINYVDLLKKEDIQNEKVKEYVEILDNKSQRLKKLTEDLVEASKASSGNVKLNIEDISIKELINQTIGEFKDRLEKRNLQVEVNMPHEDARIRADNRYIYRIMENLFSNISKYAQENSRVYVDVKNNKKKVNISIKNISKDKLNISSDELMQRFVRGDKSRYTEGSGLGLSIAKSLTELQQGTFDIIIDGDLFKVVMEWEI